MVIKIIMWIILYCMMWIVTSIAFAKWSKNAAFGWVAIGMVWPLVIVCIPIVAFMYFVGELVEKYGK